jgi:NCS2 family nucleobase:cation symporter-2
MGNRGRPDRRRLGIVAIVLGWPDFSGIQNKNPPRAASPLHFAMPQFHPIPRLTHCLVMTILFIGATGMFFASGSMTRGK